MVNGWPGRSDEEEEEEDGMAMGDAPNANLQPILP